MATSHSSAAPTAYSAPCFVVDCVWYYEGAGQWYNVGAGAVQLLARDADLVRALLASTQVLRD